MEAGLTAVGAADLAERVVARQAAGTAAGGPAGAAAGAAAESLGLGVVVVSPFSLVMGLPPGRARAKPPPPPPNEEGC